MKRWGGPARRERCSLAAASPKSQWPRLLTMPLVSSFVAPSAGKAALYVVGSRLVTIAPILVGRTNVGSLINQNLDAGGSPSGPP